MSILAVWLEREKSEAKVWQRERIWSLPPILAEFFLFIRNFSCTELSLALERAQKNLALYSFFRTFVQNKTEKQKDDANNRTSIPDFQGTEPDTTPLTPRGASGRLPLPVC